MFYFSTENEDSNSTETRPPPPPFMDSTKVPLPTLYSGTGIEGSNVPGQEGRRPRLGAIGMLLVIRLLDYN
jgi:hypothetical protein